MLCVIRSASLLVPPASSSPYSVLGRATRYEAEADSRETDLRTGDGEVSLEDGVRTLNDRLSELCRRFITGVPCRECPALLLFARFSELRRFRGESAVKERGMLLAARGEDAIMKE